MKKILTIILTAVIGSAGIIGGAYAVKKIYPNEFSDPAESVQSFYGKWIGYQAEGNPTADQIYRDSESATAGLVKKLDGIIDSFDKGGYDPVLCAQDIPEDFTAETAESNGEKALVKVTEDFYGTPKTVMVELLKDKGEWKLDNIVCHEGQASQEQNDLPSYPIRNMVGDYVREHISELSPEKEVLGGKFQISQIKFTGPYSAEIEYEDGHNLYKAGFDFEVGQDVTIKNFKIITSS